MKHNFLLLCFLSLLLSCGLFSTDNPEDPEGKKDTDLLDFKKILRGTVENFNFEDYNDLFHENFVYVDPNNITFTRARLLNKLEAIEAKYSGDAEHDSLDVIWFKADSTSNDPDWFDKTKEITLQSRAYHVQTDDETTPLKTRYSGEATFKLRFNILLDEWNISYWRDVPTDGALKSFFHPDFSN